LRWKKSRSNSDNKKFEGLAPGKAATLECQGPGDKDLLWLSIKNGTKTGLKWAGKAPGCPKTIKKMKLLRPFSLKEADSLSENLRTHDLTNLMKKAKPPTRVLLSISPKTTWVIILQVEAIKHHILL
jgi:hypothetical protein